MRECKNISVELAKKLDDSGWLEHLKQFFESGHYDKIRTFLAKRYSHGVNILPKVTDVFRAFTETPFDQVKVVIIGDGPYFTNKTSNGLAFGVNPYSVKPQLLRTIIKELEFDYSVSIPASKKTLTGWASQGVLLLNSVLTVEEGKPHSHDGIGWEDFTDFVVKTLCEKKDRLAVVALGKTAKDRISAIPIPNRINHKIIESEHINTGLGFYGLKPFSQVNDYLDRNHITPVRWECVEAGDLDINFLQTWNSKDEFYERRKFGSEYEK